MRRTNIYLEDDQLTALKHLAAEGNQSVADLVRDAINVYLARRIREDSEWQARLDRLLDRVQRRGPTDTATDEIELEIGLARAEVKEKHRAARRHRH